MSQPRIALSISRPHLSPALDTPDPGEKLNEEQGALSPSHTAWEGSSTPGWNEKSTVPSSKVTLHSPSTSTHELPDLIRPDGPIPHVTDEVWKTDLSDVLRLIPFRAISTSPSPYRLTLLTSQVAKRHIWF